MLSRTTAILAAAFFATSLILSILAGADRKPTSILNTGAPAPVAPGTPAPPIGTGAGGVLDTSSSRACSREPSRRRRHRRRRRRNRNDPYRGPGNRPFEFVGIVIRKRGDGPLVESNRAD